MATNNQIHTDSSRQLRNGIQADDMPLQMPTGMQPLYNTYEPRPVGDTQFDLAQFEPFPNASSYQSSYSHDGIDGSTSIDRFMPKASSPKVNEAALPSHASTKSKDNSPPKVKQRRNRKKKPPLPEEAQLAKRQANLDKNKKAAAKCRAKKKIIEEKQTEKLRSMKFHNKELHGTVEGMIKSFDQVSDWAAAHRECDKPADDLVQAMDRFETMKHQYHAQRIHFEESLQNYRASDRSEDGDNPHRSGSEISDAGFAVQFADGQDDIRPSMDSEMPLFNPAMSGGDDFNAFLASGGSSDNRNVLQAVDSAESRESSGYSDVPISASDWDRVRMNSRLDPYADAYLPYNNDNVYQGQFFDSPNPSFDAMDSSSLQNSMDHMNIPEMELQSQKDSAYGSPETKDQLLPLIDEQMASGEVAPISRRDSALDIELNHGPYPAPRAGQPFLNLNINGETRSPNLLARRAGRKLRSNAQQSDSQGNSLS